MKIDRELLRRLPRALRIEVEENLQRKDFPPSELAAVWRAIEVRERTAAKERQGERTDKHAGKVSTKFGRARDKIGAVAGVSGRTLQKIVAVVAAAEAEPRFGKLVEYMDETGSVDRAYKRLKIERAKDQHSKLIEDGCTVADLAALAASGKRFGVILADPPWPFETWGGVSGQGRSVENHYNTSALDEIAALPVAQLAADNCALFLWCTWPHIAIGTHVDVIWAWGFEPSTAAFVWIKQNSNAPV